jgi:hypothetical protein
MFAQVAFQNFRLVKVLIWEDLCETMKRAAHSNSWRDHEITSHICIHLNWLELFVLNSPAKNEIAMLKSPKLDGNTTEKHRAASMPGPTGEPRQQKSHHRFCTAGQQLSGLRCRCLSFGNEILHGGGIAGNAGRREEQQVGLNNHRLHRRMSTALCACHAIFPDTKGQQSGDAQKKPRIQRLLLNSWLATSAQQAV